MKNQQIINTLYDCAAYCFNCADACLEEDDVKMMVRCIRLDKICGATCVATARALAVSTDREDLKGLINYCAEICDKCANECRKHQNDHCQACAEACKKCAEACKNLA